VSELQLTLLAAVNQSRRLPDGVTKAEARGELARALDGAQRALAPASRAEYATGLTALAELFQVQVPSDTGLDLYLNAIKHVPKPAFMRAIGVLSRSHKWPRLPYPADVLDACEAGTMMLTTHLTRVELAVARLEELP
jgi:hypothetical protein